MKDIHMANRKNDIRYNRKTGKTSLASEGQKTAGGRRQGRSGGSRDHKKVSGTEKRREQEEKRDQYLLSHAGSDRLLTGRYTQHQKGFGFVTVEGRDQDIFIPADRTGSALNGDTVTLLLEKEAREDGSMRAEGRILRVDDHSVTELVGIFHKHKSFGFVTADDPHFTTDIYVDREDFLDAASGDKVVVSIRSYGDRRHKPEGVITEVLGKPGDKGVDITSAVRQSKVPYSFPDEVREELCDIPDKVRKKDMKGRTDFRGELCVTIDGDDSRDFDDAVSLRYDETRDLYILSVHIADVAQYVKEGSALDEEARLRGTSIYLPDRVIPMLPKKLSNGICSLNEGEDRLTLSCIMDIDKKGDIVGHRIVEGIIRSRRRLTYKYAYALLTDKKTARAEKDRELVEMLRLMLKLSRLLRRKRQKEGAVDFDFPESVIALDDRGRVTDIHPYEINDANRLIEDLMLAANETVAKEFCKREVPFLYRVHEAPSEEKAQELISLVQGLGFPVRRGKAGLSDPRDLSAILRKVEGSPEAPLVEKTALRSMSKARYTVECTGHYGLSKKYYTHFTSPIRRYPDLQIHRIIKDYLKSDGLKKKRIKHYAAILPGVADTCSDQERRADELERDCVKLKKCEYMSRFIGEEFDGIISGVTAYGFYVELPNTCEGMVHVNSLVDDYYVFDEKKLSLTGERRGRSFRLGDSVHIIVVSADKLMRTVDFRIYG